MKYGKVEHLVIILEMSDGFDVPKVTLQISGVKAVLNTTLGVGRYDKPEMRNLQKKMDFLRQIENDSTATKMVNDVADEILTARSRTLTQKERFLGKLSIVLNDLQITWQDGCSNPKGGRFAIGISCDCLRVGTPTGLHDSTVWVSKQLNVDGFGVFVITCPKGASEHWVSNVLETQPLESSYIFMPTKKCMLKLARNANASRSEPNHDIEGNIQQLCVSLNKQQFDSVIALSETLTHHKLRSRYQTYDRDDVLSSLSYPSEKELLEIFRIIDVDKNGFVSAAEIRRIMMCLGVRKRFTTVETVTQHLKIADYDGDGKIGIRDFQRLFARTNVSRSTRPNKWDFICACILADYREQSGVAKQKFQNLDTKRNQLTEVRIARTYVWTFSNLLFLLSESICFMLAPHKSLQRWSCLQNYAHLRRARKVYA